MPISAHAYTVALVKFGSVGGFEAGARFECFMVARLQSCADAAFEDCQLLMAVVKQAHQSHHEGLRSYTAWSTVSALLLMLDTVYKHELCALSLILSYTVVQTCPLL